MSRFNNPISLSRLSLIRQYIILPAVVAGVVLTCLVVSEMPGLLRSLNTIDTQLLLLLNFAGPQWLDNFWYTLTQTSTCLPIIIAFVYTMFATHGSIVQKIAFLVGTLLVVTLADQMASSVMKPYFGRLRPSHDPSVCLLLHYVNGYHGGMYGFVSSHAAIWTGLTVWMWYVSRSVKLRNILAVYTVAECYSRIYLGVHYPADILGGALVGWFMATTVYYIMRRLLFEPKLVLQWPIDLSVKLVVSVLVLQICLNGPAPLPQLLSMVYTL